jgi:7-keto-8-aminopelargonate synthetase-like enzyme
VAGLMKALEVATRDSSLRDKLWANTAYMRKHILDMGLDIGDSESQVMPIIIGPDSRLLYELAAGSQQRGLFLQPVTFPAVPAETGRFRMSVSAQLTQADMDEALNIIKDVIVPAVKK